MHSQSLRLPAYVVFVAAFAFGFLPGIRAQNAPRILNAANPSLYCIFQGESAMLSAVVDGDAPFTYQWLADGTAIPGATSSTFTTPAIDAPAGTLNRYALTLTNAVGTTTRQFPLTVFPTPVVGSAGIVVATVSVPGPSSRWTLTPGVTFPPSTSSPVRVEWFRNDTSLGLSSLTTASPAGTLFFNTLSPSNSGIYRVTVTDSFGHVRTSEPAALTVIERPVITRPPQPKLVVAGAAVSFSVEATGSSATSLTYQWAKDGATLPGQTGSTLQLDAATPTDAGEYRVEVGYANLAEGQMNLSRFASAPLEVAAPLVITQALPSSLSITIGTGTTLNVGIQGTAGLALAYIWRHDGEIIAGAEGPTYTLAANDPAAAGTYTMEVGYLDPDTGELLGSTTSETSISVVAAEPTVITQALPPSLKLDVGTSTALSVGAEGTAGLALAYIWRHDGEIIADADGPTYTLAVNDPAAAGTYTVEVGYLDPDTGELFGSTTSETAISVVTAALVNLSARTRLQPGTSSLTLGLVVGGSQSKSLLLRGIGPTLANYGVTQPLLRPSLSLYATGVFRQSVLRWGGSSVLLDAFARAGAFSLPLDSDDSAFTTEVSPGAYTVQLLPLDGGATGIALIEAYALDTSPSSPPLLNLSVLSTTGPGQDTLIAGFVVRSAAPRRLLIRVIGPSLAPYGVANPLPFPRLTLLDEKGAILADNLGWSDRPELAAAFAAAGAFPLSPGSTDAAAVVELPSGAYTVQASAVPGTAPSGAALIELYDLDALVPRS